MGDSGPSGPLYIALTTPAAPTNCSLIGRLRRTPGLPKAMGIRGAVSGLLCADGCCCSVNVGAMDMGLGLGRLGPMAMDLAR